MRLNPAKVVQALAGLALVLVLANIAGLLLRYKAGHLVAYGLIDLFNLDLEGNIPAFFSASLLLISSLAVAFVTAERWRLREQDRRHWAGLTLVLLYGAIDEASQVHELLIRPTREALGNLGGPFLYSWVIPGSVIVVLVGLLFVRFVVHLPPRTRLFVVLAATLFLTGAFAFEFIGGAYVSAHPGQELTTAMIATVEESLELAGELIFLYATLDYIKNAYGEIRFSLRDEVEGS